MDCTCPDSTVPCKHLAAVFYLLAERFDADPFAVLALRGRDRETVLDELRPAAPGRPSPRRCRWTRSLLPGRRRSCRPARPRLGRAARPGAGPPAGRPRPRRRRAPPALPRLDDGSNRRTRPRVRSAHRSNHSVNSGGMLAPSASSTSAVPAQRSGDDDGGHDVGDEQPAVDRAEDLDADLVVHHDVLDEHPDQQARPRAGLGDRRARKTRPWTGEVRTTRGRLPEASRAGHLHGARPGAH